MDLLHFRMPGKMRGDLQGVGAMLLHAQGQGLGPAQDVRVAFAHEIFRYRDRFVGRHGFNREPGRDIAEQRQFDGATARASGHHFDRPAAIPGALDESFFLQVGQMFVHRGERREAEAAADFLQTRRVPVLLDELIQVVENLALPLGEWKHVCASFEPFFQRSAEHYTQKEGEGQQNRRDAFGRNLYKWRLV